MRVKGFTVMELLVVISIITLLIALVMPSFKHGKLRAEQSECLSNLSHMGRAMHAFETDANGFLPGPSWYGQTPKYNSGTKDLSRWLATYLGYPRPEGKVHVNGMFICPSFHRVKPSGYNVQDCVIYGALSQLNDQGKRVFGYPAFNGAPEYGPDKLINVRNPSKARAVRDIDVLATPTAGWVNQTARTPTHLYFGGPTAERNYLFFDTHAEIIAEPAN